MLAPVFMCRAAGKLAGVAYAPRYNYIFYMSHRLPSMFLEHFATPLEAEMPVNGSEDPRKKAGRERRTEPRARTAQRRKAA